jgi:hypothetical protein
MQGEGVAGPALPGRPAGEDGAERSAVVATTPASAAVERASTLDAGFFRRHPDRAHRVRAAVPGEFPADWRPEAARGRLTLVVVKQLTAGVRLRLLFLASRRPCSCEACAGRLWERAASEKVREGALAVAAALVGRAR